MIEDNTILIKNQEEEKKMILEDVKAQQSEEEEKSSSKLTVDDAKSENLLTERIGAVGFGAMNRALVQGFLKSGITSVEKLSILVRSQIKEEEALSIGVQNVFMDKDFKKMAELCDVIILGVKPQGFLETLENLAPYITENHLVVSIAAGIKIKDIESRLVENARVICTMPNTPCMVGCGAVGYALGKAATAEDSKIVNTLFSSVGIAVEVAEQKLSAVAGVSGSSPAYVYMMIEAMADGAVAAGLPRDIALKLAAKATEGAARMVLDSSSSDSHPGVLKDKVASPGGSTIQAIRELEERGMRSAFINAVLTSAKKTAQLGQ